jgi:hypothetical protein
MKKNQAVILFKTNGLLAASAIGLPTCSRIQGLGQTMLLQQCAVKTVVLTLSPPLNQAKIGSFGGLQFSEKGDEGIAASPRINHFVQNFTENTMVKSAIF